MKMNKSKTADRFVLSSFVDSNVTGYASTHVLKHCPYKKKGENNQSSYLR